MSDKITFTLDGREVEAAPGETIWQVAKRVGTDIPHLCYRDEPGYRADGNCRACMVEIEGERVLAASCIRTPAEGMKVVSQNERATKARRMVMELLVADQPERAEAHDRVSSFWRWADYQDVTESRFPANGAPAPDLSHPAMAVNLDACIHCTLCVRACREVQVNDVIGMAYRGPHEKIVFDQDDPMGGSTCVACGECVQACPTGALMPASIVDEAGHGTREHDEEVNSVCPYCGVGCQITYKLRDGKIAFVDGATGPANENRLCVKGRFGFDYVASPERLTVPLIRKEGVAKGPHPDVDPADPSTHFREATWEEALDRAASGLKKVYDEGTGSALAGFGSAKGSNEEAYLFQKFIRTAFHTNNVDHCTRLCHASSVAALMEGVNSGAVTAPFTAAEDAECIIVIGARPAENHPVAATGLRQVRDANGGNALAGFGSAKCSNEEAYLFQKLVRAGFGTNNVDHCTRLCHASSVAALMETIGSGAVTAPFTAVRDSDVIIVIGANPTSNHPVAATYFKQAAKRGAKLIVMDPRGHGLKRHATHMLQFKPGGDVALLNSIMHVIVEEGLYDQQYIQAHTDGFERLKAHLASFTPEAMEAVSGIAPDVVREVARTYAKANAAIIFWGMGVSQHVHGTDNARCLISLALMAGQVGRKGTGLHPLRGQNNVQGASDAGLIPMVFPDYLKTSDDAVRGKLEELWQAKLDPTPGLTVVEIVDAIHADKIKAMYIQGENPAMSDPDVAHAREALARLEHLVVADIFLTETAMYADVVLPATAWPEKDGTVTNTNRQVQMGRKALDAPGEAKPDWWITQEIAKRLGLDWNYQHPSEVFAEMKHAMPSLDNITWERVEAENSVTYPSLAPDQPGEEIVFGDRFPTADGLGKFVPAEIVPPDEQPDTEYPMILTTGRQLEHWHTGAMTRRATNLDAIEPEPVANMSPAQIRKLGIAPGDTVRVETRRGVIELKARADGAVPDGVVFIPFAYVEAAANLLTNPALDPFGKIPEFKFCAARITPAEARQAAE